MNKQQLEDLYIRSLDQPLPVEDEKRLLKALDDYPDWAWSLSTHKQIRELLPTQSSATFGPSFASQLVDEIQYTGLLIDRQLARLFRKFQVAAIGTVVALILLNVAFTERGNWQSVLGIDNDPEPTPVLEAPFNFSETITNL